MKRRQRACRFHAHAAAAAAVVLLLAGAAPGCQSAQKALGVAPAEPKRFGDDTLARLKTGETRRSWVLAVLGAPDRKSTLADGHTEIWQYDYQPPQQPSRASRAKDVAKPATGVVYVEMTRGVVSDWWKG